MKYNFLKQKCLLKTWISLKELEKVSERQLSNNFFYKWYDWLINADKEVFIVILNIKYWKSA